MISGVHINTDLFDTAMADIYLRSDKSNMWALREAGRQTKRIARRKVRVYGGKKNTTSGREVNVTSGPKIGGTRVGGKSSGGRRAYTGKTATVIPGELRDSISPSRRFTTIAPRTYRLSVGPRGGHVHLYAAKIEALDHYMEEAAAAVIPKFAGIQEAAMARVLAKYGPVSVFGRA